MDHEIKCHILHFRFILLGHLESCVGVHANAMINNGKESKITLCLTIAASVKKDKF